MNIFYSKKVEKYFFDPPKIGKFKKDSNNIIYINIGNKNIGYLIEIDVKINFFTEKIIDFRQRVYGDPFIIAYTSFFVDNYKNLKIKELKNHIILEKINKELEIPLSRRYGTLVISKIIDKIEMEFLMKNIQNSLNLNLTKKAIRYITNLIKKKKSIGIYLNVKKSGCSGFYYFLKLLDSKSISSYDIKYQISYNPELFIYINPKLFNFFNGIKIDYIYDKKKFESKLVFFNPNEKKKCSCGHSFSLE